MVRHVGGRTAGHRSEDPGFDRYKIREQKQESDTTWYIIATYGSRLGDFISGGTSGYMIMRIRLVGSRPDSTHVWVHTREDIFNFLPVWQGMILKRIGQELCRRRVRASPSAKPSSCAGSEPPEDRCPWPPSPLLNHTETNQCSDSASSTQSSRPQRRRTSA